MASHHGRLATTGTALVLAAGLLRPTHALAELKPGLELDAAAAGSSNPLLLPGTDGEAAIVDIAIRPSLQISDDTGSSIELASLIARRSYSRLYANLVYGNMHLVTTWRRNERLSVLATAAFDRDPLIDRLTSDIDASINSRGVRESWSGDISAIWRPDAYTRIGPELRVETARYPGAALLRETHATTIAFHASRRISPYTTLGARISYVQNAVDAAPDSKMLSTYGTIEQRLSPAWLLRAQLGLEHTRSRETLGPPPSPEERRTQIAGRAELCRQTTRLNVCAGGVLTSEVSGLGGLQRQFELMSSLRWRLTERLDVVLQGNYQRAAQQGSNLPDLDAAEAFIRLDRQLSKTLTASAIAGYRYREPLVGRAFSASMFGVELKYRLGQR